MDDLELIKDRINVVDLIQEYIPLKKMGANFKANCPFHHEKTPSFVVSPERGIWHCFGCDKGGDIFKFVMEKEGLDFKDAVELLAQKAGVELKRSTKENNTNDRFFEANQKAQQFYQYMLVEHPLGRKALEYVKYRGLTDETIKTFGIGYAPHNWEALTKFLKKRGFSVEEMVNAGLCVPGKVGCYDRFRGRIMFPLIDIKGRIIGFSGRVLDKGEPKYINTPQTPIFDKKRFLFGFHLSKGAAKEKGMAIIVEGEMDMILSFQSGVKNIAASKGTALTQEQVELIKKYADTVDLCFDTDLAGDAASRRGIELADQAGLNIKVIQFTGAKDPAELCVQDAKLWEKAVDEATPIYDYYLQSVERRFNLKDSAGKRTAFAELAPIWKKISDPILKEHYTQKLAALLLMKEDLIRKTIDSWQPSYDRLLVSKNQSEKEENKVLPIVKTPPPDRQKLLEEYLLALLLHIPIDHTYIPKFPETLFTQEELKQIYVMLVLFLDSISFKGKGFKIDIFIQTLSPELVSLTDKLYLIDIDEKLSEKKNWQPEVDMVVTELKKMLIKNSLEKLSLQIKQAQEFDQMEKVQLLNKRFRDLSLKLKNL